MIIIYRIIKYDLYIYGKMFKVIKLFKFFIKGLSFFLGF